MVKHVILAMPHTLKQPANSMKEAHIAVGIIWSNDRKQLLISERLAEKEFGGYLEFPGGKIEANETPEQALVRELQEELAITPIHFDRYHSFDYHYPEKLMHFYFFHIWKYQGEALACEQQIIRWLALANLEAKYFPPDNALLLAKLQAEYLC